MHIRTPLMGAALAAACIGLACTFAHASPAIPEHDSVLIAVDANAALHVTLSPAVSVFAEATHLDRIVAMRIAATEALPVTLLPTVHVSAVNGLCGGATNTRSRKAQSARSASPNSALRRE